MPIECEADSLAELAECFNGMSPSQLDAAKTYLLAVAAGASTDPNTLASLAACFDGISKPQQEAIQTYLLCQIAN